MKTKSEREFVELLEKNQNIVHKICRIYANSSDEHKDLFQEIAIQLWKSYPYFRGDSKFSTWMYSISLNTAMSLFRKNKKYKNEVSFSLTEHNFKQEETENIDEKINTMYQAIHQLNDVEKALIMMYLDDKNYDEISEILGITQGNARVKMNRAKNKLKLLIKNL